MPERINKVLYDVDQRGDTTPAEKKMARDNIGAVSADESCILKRNNAVLYYHHMDDSTQVYHVRGIKNNAMNHVTVANHSSDICSLTIEAPAIGADEEYNYYVVFDCYGSSGTCGVDVENASPRLVEKYVLEIDGMHLKTNLADSASDAITPEAIVKDSSGNNKFLRIDRAYYNAPIEEKTLAGPLVLTEASLTSHAATKQYVDFGGSTTYMIHVIGGMWELFEY